MSTSPWTGLILDSLDTLFFRDGRPFDAANRIQSGWPTPQTLAGSLRTALLGRTGFSFNNSRLFAKTSIEQQLLNLGADQGVVHARFRGPFLALVDDNLKVEPLLPLPVVLTRAKRGKQDKWSWARPALPGSVAGWNDPDGLSPLVRKGDPDKKADRGMITLAGLKQFLGGNEPDLKDVISEDELFKFDDRVGIAIDPNTLTAGDGQIYSIGLLALKNSAMDQKRLSDRRVCLYAEIQLGDGSSLDVSALLDRSPILFGGESRSVRASAARTPVDWPVVNQTVTRSVWYLATPAFQPRSSTSRRPLPKLDGLKAAASESGLAVSGWDVMRKGPRATRFAVPAGAVYYVEGSGNESGFLDDQLEDAANLRREGWGFALQGVWKDQ